MRLARIPVAIASQRDMLIPVLMVIGIFLCGLVCGALTLRGINPLVQEELRQYLDFFLKEASAFSGQSFSGFKAWCQILSMQAFSLGLLWIFGLTVVGSPLIILVIGARGFIIGFTVGYLVQEAAGQGLVLALAGVLPQNLCYIPAFLGAGALAFYFSFTLLRGQRDAPFQRLGVYSLLFLFFLLLVLIGAWVEAYLVPGLLRLILSLFH